MCVNGSILLVYINFDDNTNILVDYVDAKMFITPLQMVYVMFYWLIFDVAGHANAFGMDR